jgi:inhibitor of KinA sporulation pathway (predicted exonuclease)
MHWPFTKKLKVAQPAANHKFDSSQQRQKGLGLSQSKRRKRIMAEENELTTTTSDERPTAAPLKSYYLVMDFEATCEENVRAWPNEIIEFPAVLIDRTSLETVDEFRAVVRPTERPILTAFCTNLTGIQQTDVDNADPLDVVLDRFTTWLSLHGITTNGNAFPIFCGDWDLGKCLPAECRRKQISVDRVPEVLSSWCNIKKVFAAHYALQGRQKGMAGMLAHLNLPLVGHHHSGIDDSRNIAQIVRALVMDGCQLVAPTSSTAHTADRQQRRRCRPTERASDD